jgi:hypothetical protein
MSGPLRPKFSEGQILGAADLNAQVDYERLAAVQHERTEHLWGVAQGLTLTTAPNKDSNSVDYVDVSLQPGRAVDRLGRSIVVTAVVPLDPGDFKQQVATRDKTKRCPVFVQVVDVERSGETQPGKCTVNVTTRVEETVRIVFGNPGTELAILDQAEATVDQDLTTATPSDMVLVGWVQFDPSISNGEGKFIATATEGNGARIRYVGVVASDVVAGGGELQLHTRPDGQRFMLSITEDATGGCKLEFGKQDGSNPMAPTFSVNEKGDITYIGALIPTPPSKTQAQSGFAYDGIALPLPDGIKQDDVDKGNVLLHMMVTPIPLPPTKLVFPGSGIATEVLALMECSVDPISRIVTSLVRWADPAKPASNYLVLPVRCRYLIIASGV